MKQNVIVLLFFIVFSNNMIAHQKQEFKIPSLANLCYIYIALNIDYYTDNYLSHLKTLPVSLKDKISIVVRNLAYGKIKITKANVRSISELKDIAFLPDSNYIATVAYWVTGDTVLSKMQILPSINFIEKGSKMDVSWERQRAIHLVKALPEQGDLIVGCSKGIVELTTSEGKIISRYINRVYHEAAITTLDLHYGSTQKETDYFIAGLSSLHDSCINLWKIDEPCEPTKFKGDYAIKALACLQQAKQFLVLEKDYRNEQKSALKLWDIATQKELHRWTGVCSNPVRAMTLLNHDILLAGTNYGYFALFDARTNEIRKEHPAHECGAISSIAANAQNDLVVSGCENGEVKLWDTRLLRWSIGSCECDEGQNQWVTKVDFAPNGTKVAAIMLERHLAAWDVNSFNQIAAQKEMFY